MYREQTPRERGVLLAHTMREQLYGRGAYKELHDLPQWLNWQYQLINGELKKVPINPRTGHNGSTVNPRTWGTLPQALKRVEFGKVEGIGIVVTQNDPYCIVDIDGSADRQKRIITSALGLRVVKLLDTITEFSPNNGLHMVVELGKPLPEAVKSDVE